MSDPLLRVVPGLREAVEEESRLRDDSFLDAPEFVCGVEVEPLTLERFILLNAIRSPFLVGGRVPGATDIGLFLWVMSPQYRRAIAAQRTIWPVSRRLAMGWLWVARRLFVRRLRHLDAAQATLAIFQFVDSALFDAPKGKGCREAPGYWSAFGGLVFGIACETGWSEREIMRLPVKRLFQYGRMSRVRRDPDAALFNPLSGGKITEWLKAENERRNFDPTRS